ncbi:MAG: DUF5059 domain-containing protein [Haloarculaceae archaeon]
MHERRRDLLKTLGVAAGTALAGCTTAATGGQTTTDDGTETSAKASVTADVAVAAEWNVLRARVHDPVVLARAGDPASGASLVADLFADFEGMTGEYGAHERLEATSESAYEGFEGALSSLREALDGGDVEAAAEAAETADGHLATAQTTLVGSTPSQALTLQLLGTRTATAEVPAAVGAFDAARAVADGAAAAFEGVLVHQTVERVAPDAYESFEGALDGVVEAATDGDAAGVRERARAALDAAVTGSYAVADAERVAGVGHLATMQARGFDAAALSSLGGSGTDSAHADAAAAVVKDVRESFEGTRVQELLANADGEAAESVEASLNGYGAALGDESAGAALDRFVRAALRAEFVVAGAGSKVPDGSGNDESEPESESTVIGGPNVVEGVPDDADHVVELQTVSFAPDDLTVQAGDTVAFAHDGGEAHTVTAYADGIPADASYWASGGFASQDAAESGWHEERTGGVVFGTAYVRTFETVGTHRYFCIPHEAAGMAGRIVVER